MAAIRKVGILTSGGIAPCLNASVGCLIDTYTRVAPAARIVCYLHGFAGLLKGESLKVGAAARRRALDLLHFGGSAIGNSRVRLTNVRDCVARGLVRKGQDPQEVAAERLAHDGIDVLHAIGGDDTAAAAAELSRFLKERGRRLTVIVLPKTIDNDIHPVRQSLGALTAAEQGARFFANVVAEHGASPRMLIVHEVMGRYCGWLTAATARAYRTILDDLPFVPALGLRRRRREVHGVYVPEMSFDLRAEAGRLRAIMDREDCVNIFVAEGACAETIIGEMTARGERVPLDAFGHPRLDKVNAGEWFARRLAPLLGAGKTLVQKSGYFCRSAPPNAADLTLARQSCEKAVACALQGLEGVVGQDEERGGRLGIIAFDRVSSGKPLAIDAPAFTRLLRAIGQPQGAPAKPPHRP
jgi:pyrophosphate--fructose-6-phosphate 1-phosphotransferase